jgi:hypothetical protein
MITQGIVTVMPGPGSLPGHSGWQNLPPDDDDLDSEADSDSDLPLAAGHAGAVRCHCADTSLPAGGTPSRLFPAVSRGSACCVVPAPSKADQDLAPQASPARSVTVSRPGLIFRPAGGGAVQVARLGWRRPLLSRADPDVLRVPALASGVTPSRLAWTRRVRVLKAR